MSSFIQFRSSLLVNFVFSFILNQDSKQPQKGQLGPRKGRRCNRCTQTARSLRRAHSQIIFLFFAAAAAALRPLRLSHRQHRVPHFLLCQQIFSLFLVSFSDSTPIHAEIPQSWVECTPLGTYLSWERVSDIESASNHPLFFHCHRNHQNITTIITINTNTQQQRHLQECSSLPTICSNGKLFLFPLLFCAFIRKVSN